MLLLTTDEKDEGTARLGKQAHGTPHTQTAQLKVEGGQLWGRTAC